MGGRVGNGGGRGVNRGAAVEGLGVDGSVRGPIVEWAVQTCSRTCLAGLQA